MPTEPLTAPHPRRLGPVVALTVALALMWPALHVASEGSVDALLWVGVDGPAHSKVVEDIPDIRAFSGLGHDGQIYYVISRHPLDPKASGDAVEDKAFRYRRILFPAVASVLAPSGGRAVIAVFLVESLVGIALGAWALGRLGGPRWLPLTMAVNPGLMVAMTISLADVLAAGLGLAALALATERRWRPMLALLVLAVLTRETLILVAAGAALTPGMPWRHRVAAVAVPGASLAAWSAWIAARAGESVTGDGGSNIAFPVTGWLADSVGADDLVAGLGALALLAVGAWQVRTSAPQVAGTLVLGAVLLLSYSEIVAGYGWENIFRPVAPMVALAVWALLRDVGDGTPGAHRSATDRVEQGVGA